MDVLLVPVGNGANDAKVNPQHVCRGAYGVNPKAFENLKHFEVVRWHRFRRTLN